MGSLKSNTFSFKVVLLLGFCNCSDGRGFACQDSSVEFCISCDLNEANISRNLIAGLEEQDIARDDVGRRDALLIGIAKDETVFWEHACDAVHDAGGGEVLPCVEQALYEPYSDEYDGQCKVSHSRWVTKRFPADEDQNATSEQDRAKATKEVPKEVLKESRLRRRVDVAAKLGDSFFDGISVQPDTRVDALSFVELFGRDQMPVLIAND